MVLLVHSMDLVPLPEWAIDSLTENVFKQISAKPNLNPNPNSNLNPKAQNRFRENKMTSFFQIPHYLLQLMSKDNTSNIYQIKPSIHIHYTTFYSVFALYRSFQYQYLFN